jgi:hypothetical protein
MYGRWSNIHKADGLGGDMETVVRESQPFNLEEGSKKE